MSAKNRENGVEQTEAQILDVLYLSESDPEAELGQESNSSPIFPLELSRVKNVELVGEASLKQEVLPEMPEKMQEIAPKAQDEESGNLQEINKLKEEIESKFEKVPTKEEILSVIGVELKDCTVVVEKADEKGVYHFEITVKSEKEGEVIEYDYRRSGEFDGRHTAGGYSSLAWEGGTASIHKAVYDDNGEFITYPEHIYEYRSDTGEWKKPEDWKD